MGHGHNTDDCIQLKDVYSSMFKAINGTEKDPLKLNLPQEFLSLAMALRREKLARENAMYIVFITGGSPRAYPLLKKRSRGRLLR